VNRKVISLSLNIAKESLILKIRKSRKSEVTFLSALSMYIKGINQRGACALVVVSMQKHRISEPPK